MARRQELSRCLPETRDWAYLPGPCPNANPTPPLRGPALPAALPERALHHPRHRPDPFLLDKDKL
eukprot:2934319-Lingulodinium_polyedra.AAC.1